MKRQQRIGIIDIGSNSIRLVIFEQTERGAFRVVDESKKSARLSQLVDSVGKLPIMDMMPIVETLNHFKRLCLAHRTSKIRAVATAAIRNAANSLNVLRFLETNTDLQIEIISGEEEARLGFLGMINTIDIKDGWLVDIGGGSTEVTLFRNRQIVQSVSFPFGAVNCSIRYCPEGSMSDKQAFMVTSMVEDAITCESWIREHPGLPLVGLGGTIRTLARIEQRRTKYALPMIHNYTMQDSNIALIEDTLRATPLEIRKKTEGLGKDRADIILPGIVILRTLLRLSGSTEYVVCGSGLRDGLMFETMYGKDSNLKEVLEQSIRNMLMLHTSISEKHVEQVDALSSELYRGLLVGEIPLPIKPEYSRYLHTAALLYRIGVSVHFDQFDKHTFYLMTHSHINGLQHREIVLCASIASFQSKSKAKAMMLPFKKIMQADDLEIACLLGSLLRLAIALDRSETQPILKLSPVLHRNELRLYVECRHSPHIERTEIEEFSKDFSKIWGLRAVMYE